MTTSSSQVKPLSSSQRWLRVVGICIALAVVVAVRARSRARPPVKAAPTSAPPRSPTPHQAARRFPARRVATREPEPPATIEAATPTALVPSSAVPQVSTPPQVIAPAPLASTPVAPPASAETQIAVMHHTRQVLRAAVAAWSKPGLCTRVADAAGARETVSSNFRRLELGERGTVYVDPRLPADAELPILGYLDRAENEVGTRLGLRPPRPVTFVYADQRLMKASACINEEVVAFYDGALHIVASRPDGLASVLHEYTHHALFSAGLMAPTWAHEGIAMNIAKELWWRGPRYLQTLLANPFGMDDMDRVIAYKLKPEQALAFYVQSAATVECVLRERHWSLRELFTAFSSGANANSVTYDLPELDRSSFLSDCIARGLGGAPAGQ